jgi:hypothetical protein
LLNNRKMKNIKLILFVVALATLNFSCIVDDTTGEDQLNAFGESSYIVGFKSGNAVLTYFNDVGVVRREFPIELLGGLTGFASDSAINISYEVDASSTAVLGQEFNFVSNTGTLELAAGDTFVNFPLDVNTGSLDPDAPTTLILNLTATDTSNSVVSSNNQTLVITFVGCQADLAGTYSVTNDFCGSVTTTTISANPDGSWALGIGDGYFLAGCTSNVSLLNPASISIICGDVLPTAGPSFCSSNGIGCITGGSWDAVNGILTMTHTDTFFNGGPYDWTSTYTRL